MLHDAAIVDRLGGEKALRASPHSVGEWHSLIDEGLPAVALELVKDLLQLSDVEAARLAGVSAKTFSRKRGRAGRLDAVTSDRLYRVVRIVTLAADVLESEQGGIAWLKRAQVGLGGSVPLDLLRSDAGTTAVERLLLRIEHGVYA